MLGQHGLPLNLRRRLQVYATGTVVVFALLIGRLWFLQILEGPKHRAHSENNRIRNRRTHATRGAIVDRAGRVLVDSRPSFDAVLVSEDTPDLDTTLTTLAGFLGQNKADTARIRQQTNTRRRFEEILIKRDLDRHELVALETHQLELPGVHIDVTPRRHYPRGSVLAHILGYVGEIGAKQLKGDSSYRAGDLTGKAGLERTWERVLRGKDGSESVEVDSVGRELRVLDRTPETRGHTLVLSIDLDVQNAAEEALGDQAGAIVALDPSTGHTLALVSHPSFDPNLFARGINTREWSKLRDNPLHPLTNRTVRGLYPPGSTFKIVVATAALEEGVITPFTTIFCPGGLQFGSHFFRCWRHGGHGRMDVHRALVESCDVFFYQIAQRLGIDVIAQYARAFGLGQPTGIGVEHEARGLIPDSAWKMRALGEPWYAGETLSAGIGQGYVTVTPIQMAQATAALATGVRYRPQLVARIETYDHQLVKDFPPEEQGRVPARDVTLAQVRSGLIDVVNSEHGTGKKAQLPEITVAGKSGTSQSVTGLRKHGNGQIPWKERDHAWFVAYAPAENPQIVVAAVAEHAGAGGGAVAAPMVHDVLEAFFHQRPYPGSIRYASN